MVLRQKVSGLKKENLKKYLLFRQKFHLFLYILSFAVRHIPISFTILHLTPYALYRTPSSSNSETRSSTRKNVDNPLDRPMAICYSGICS